MNKKTSNKEKELSMDELLAQVGAVRGFKKFDHVTAKFISFDRSQALFDVGGKSEAVVSEEHFREAKDLIKSLKAGDEVEAVVMDPETKDGKILLSLRHAAHKRLWTKLQDHYEKNEPVNVVGQLVTDKGVAVTLGPVDSFVPVTQLTQEHAQSMDSLIGIPFKVQIIEIDSTRNRLVLSERAIYEASDTRKVKELLKKVTLGQKYKGIVTTITSFGAFVEIPVDENNKIEGLVHVSELSWGKTSHPQDLLTEGDEVEVVALSTDGEKLALSIKQAQEDPWETVSERYHVDDRVGGVVVKQSDFGVFVELEPGIEGLIHMTKIPPTMKLVKGEEVNCYVEEVSPKEHRISLGIIMTSAKPIGYK